MKTAQITMDIDENLKLDFKVWCVRHHKSMTEITERLLKNFLQEQKDKETRKE